MNTTNEKEMSRQTGNAVDGNEIIEILRSSVAPPAPGAATRSTLDDEPVITRELLCEMGRLAAPFTLIPAPAPRRDRQVILWLGAAAAVTAMFLSGAHAFATLRAQPEELRRVPAPVAVASPMMAALPGPAPAAPAGEDEADVEPEPGTGADRWVSRREGQAGSRLTGRSATAGQDALPDNPYGAIDAADPAPVAAPPSTAAAEPAPGATGSSVESLIDSALARPSAGRASGSSLGTNDLPGANAGSLRHKPSRDEVRRAMDEVAARVRECGGSPYDRLVLELVVKGATGRVDGARTVDAQHAGTPVGVCAARAARLAKLPRFASEELVVRYPIDL